MRSNLAPSVSLDFLDGYLFRLLQEIASDGGKESGFLDYYASRLDEKIGGLMEYEERLARHLLDNYNGRRIVHVGTGIGTLPCVLACNGMTVTGIESYHLRVVSAQRIRSAIVDVWPEVDRRYDIIEGRYPQALPFNQCGPDSILVFTNVAAGWNKADEASIIKSMRLFGESILDLRLFGSVRDAQNERTDLFRRIASTAQSAELLPDIAGVAGAHFARFVFS